MKYIGHQFPVHRSNTITRANVQLAMASDPFLDTPEKVAEHFCGTRAASNHQFARLRHIARARVLMQPRRSQ